MSKDAAAKFIEKLAADPALQAQVTRAVEGKDDKAAAAAVAAIGKAKGFDFSADEAMAACPRPASGELGAEELEKVSGGNVSSHPYGSQGYYNWLRSLPTNPAVTNRELGIE